MAKIERFGDIEAWQKARELARRIYNALSGGSFTRGFGLRDQVRRAAVFIMSNIAEEYGCGGNGEFVQFLSVVKGSVSEAQAQPYVAVNVGCLTKEQFQQLYSLSQSARNLIGGFIRYFTKSADKGVKFA